VLSTALIVFREVLEAALIIGVVLTATQGVVGRRRWVTFGVGAGLLGACVVAIFAEAIAQAAEGVGQELFNAGVLLAAMGMLAWHNLWMARHGRELANQMNAVGRDVSEGSRPLHVLSIVVALAVLREGAEVVLFAYGIAAGGANTLSMFSGGALGIVAGAAIGTALYFGLVHIPMRYLFTVTSWLIVLLAAGMASQACAYLIQAGIVPAIKPVLWDTSALLSKHSLVGEMLHTLVGYDDRPAAMQFIVYVAAIAIIGGLTVAARKPAGLRMAAVSALLLAIVVAATFVMPAPAFASHKVYYPTVDQGETELEMRGHVTWDNDRDKQNEQTYKFGVGHGFTSYWFSEIYVEAEKPAGESSYEIESYEWENLFQLTEQGKYWADWGFLIEYAKARDSDDPNKVELTPIMQTQFGKTLFTVNLKFERETGDNADDDWMQAYAWQLRWFGNPKLEFGVEGYGELGKVDNWNSWDEQEHQVGPAIFGKLKTDGGHAWKYRLALLAGLTSDTPNATLAGTLEYEF